MFDTRQFFKKRLFKHVRELNRYLKYMFNGHIAFAMFFFISAFAVFYQSWLQDLPESFPTGIIIGAVFGLLAAHSPVRTLLKKPDLVFLLAAEQELKPYFKRSLLYSYVMQLYVVFLVAAALGPLYFMTYDERSARIYVLTGALILVFKFASLCLTWWSLKLHTETGSLIERLVRSGLTIGIFISIITGYLLFVGLFTIGFIGLFIYIYMQSRRVKTVNWEVLLEKDYEKMYLFYRIANLFTEVPHLQTKTKRRRLTSLLFASKKYVPAKSFSYLYTRTFLRSGDYFSMYLRLTIVGVVLIYAMPFWIMKLLIGLLFLYICNLQLMPLYQHHDYVLWLELYPIESYRKVQAVLKLLFTTATIQLVLFVLTIGFTSSFIDGIYALVGGFIFNVYFIYIFARKNFLKNK